MKAPDLKSTIIAAVIGAAAAALLNYLATTSTGETFTTSQAAMYGGIIGATVQVGVRLSGVS